MSTSYRSLKPIAFDKIFDGRLQKYGIEEVVLEQTSPLVRFLSHKSGVLMITRQEDGTSSFELVAAPGILSALGREFQTELKFRSRFWRLNDAENSELAKNDSASADTSGLSFKAEETDQPFNAAEFFRKKFNRHKDNR